MTIEEARRHPAYKKACHWCHKNGIRGTMDDIDFGIPVYLAGYDRAKKDKENEGIKLASFARISKKDKELRE